MPDVAETGLQAGEARLLKPVFLELAVQGR
jgi:hypothetical protein